MTADREPAPTARVAVSSRRILTATGLALSVAVVWLTAAVLPAQYGVDPMGIGRVLDMTGRFRASAIVAQPTMLQHDEIEFVLGPYQFVEYKYQVETGASMVFSWVATRNVTYDFHSEPDGAPEGSAESFDQQESDRAHGTYVAPFSGLHGWYWENGGAGDVSIRLKTSGFYQGAVEYFDGKIIPRPLAGATRVRSD